MNILLLRFNDCFPGPVSQAEKLAGLCIITSSFVMRRGRYVLKETEWRAMYDKVLK